MIMYLYYKVQDRINASWFILVLSDLFLNPQKTSIYKTIDRRWIANLRIKV